MSPAEAVTSSQQLRPRPAEGAACPSTERARPRSVSSGSAPLVRPLVPTETRLGLEAEAGPGLGRRLPRQESDSGVAASIEHRRRGLRSRAPSERGLPAGAYVLRAPAPGGAGGSPGSEGPCVLGARLSSAAAESGPEGRGQPCPGPCDNNRDRRRSNNEPGMAHRAVPANQDRPGVSAASGGSEPSKAGARATNTAGDTGDALKTFKRKDYTERVSAFLAAQTVKTLPAVWETRAQSLDLEDPLEKQMATHSCVLARKIPWTEEPGRLQSMGPQRVGQD